MDYEKLAATLDKYSEAQATKLISTFGGSALAAERNLI
jgi:hypothetical protein